MSDNLSNQLGNLNIKTEDEIKKEPTEYENDLGTSSSNQVKNEIKKEQNEAGDGTKSQESSISKLTDKCRCGRIVTADLNTQTIKTAKDYTGLMKILIENKGTLSDKQQLDLKQMNAEIKNKFRSEPKKDRHCYLILYPTREDMFEDTSNLGFEEFCDSILAVFKGIDNAINLKMFEIRNASPPKSELEKKVHEMWSSGRMQVPVHKIKQDISEGEALLRKKCVLDVLLLEDTANKQEANSVGTIDYSEVERIGAYSLYEAWQAIRNNGIRIWRDKPSIENEASETKPKNEIKNAPIETVNGDNSQGSSISKLTDKCRCGRIVTADLNTQMIKTAKDYTGLMKTLIENKGTLSDKQQLDLKQMNAEIKNKFRSEPKKDRHCYLILYPIREDMFEDTSNLGFEEFCDSILAVFKGKKTNRDTLTEKMLVIRNASPPKSELEKKVHEMWNSGKSVPVHKIKQKISEGEALLRKKCVLDVLLLEDTANKHEANSVGTIDYSEVERIGAYSLYEAWQAIRNNGIRIWRDKPATKN